MTDVKATTAVTSDFVDVQLTAAGREMAGGSPLRISVSGCRSGRREFMFQPPDYKLAHSEKAFEWLGVLRNYTHDGTPLVEMQSTPDASAAKPAATGPESDGAKK